MSGKTLSERDTDSEVRSTAGMSPAEKIVIILIAVIAVAVAIPTFLRLNARAQLSANRVNLTNVRKDARTKILVGVGSEDATDAAGRNMSEGLSSGSGWVAIAYVDKGNNVTDLKVFVVDDLSSYHEGIAPGKLKEPVPVGSDITFYEAPDSDNISYPFAKVKPTANGNSVYTVQALIDTAYAFPPR